MARSTYILISVLFVSLCPGVLNAATIPMEIFTHDGQYSDSPSVDLYFNVIPTSQGMDFTFHNDSTVKSSIARIYIDDSGLLAFNSITNGEGTAFHPGASPKNLPGGHSLDSRFEADFSLGADSPPPKNGINPGELVTISFNLTQNTTTTDVINSLNNDKLRVGVHLIAMPDGSSESAILSPRIIPEPATLCLLALGAIALIRKKQ